MLATMPCARVSPLTLGVLLTLGGCGPAVVGQDPDVIWWADHEAGDFSEWDTGGYHWSTEGGSTRIVTAVARSGRHSFESSVSSLEPGRQSGAQASRSGSLPTEAFYSAWFYLPERVSSTSYLVLTKFRSRSDPANSATIVNTWDIDILTDASGSMFPQLYDHAETQGLWRTDFRIPVDRWFQIEVFLRAVNDDTGRITVWFDGELLFDVTGKATIPSSIFEWSVGSVAEEIAPSPAVIFIDDAAISKRRLGPDFPAFWRP